MITLILLIPGKWVIIQIAITITYSSTIYNYNINLRTLLPSESFLLLEVILVYTYLTNKINKISYMHHIWCHISLRLDNHNSTNIHEVILYKFLRKINYIAQTILISLFILKDIHHQQNIICVPISTYRIEGWQLDTLP